MKQILFLTALIFGSKLLAGAPAVNAVTAAIAGA